MDTLSSVKCVKSSFVNVTDSRECMCTYYKSSDLEVLDVLFLLGQPLLLLFLWSWLVLTQLLPHRCKHRCYLALFSVSLLMFTRYHRSRKMGTVVVGSTQLWTESSVACGMLPLSVAPCAVCTPASAIPGSCWAPSSAAPGYAAGTSFHHLQMSSAAQTAEIKWETNLPPQKHLLQL